MPSKNKQDETPSNPPHPFDHLRELADQPDYRKLVGKFHAHLTFNLRDDQIELCREWCREHKVKLTIVDLANSAGISQTDVMLTVHFRDNDMGAVQRMTERLLELASLAEVAEFPVTRLKLEHESLPSLPTFDKHRYHEVHIKLEIPADTFEADYQRLLALGDAVGFVPSRNPYQRDKKIVTQFANLRIYEGTHEAADSQIERVTEALTQASFSIKEVKRETVVFDTAQALDAWWA